MDGIGVLEATADDADVVADYHQRCFETTYAAQLASGELEAPDRDGTEQQLRGWFRPGSGFVTRVAVVDDTPIAHFAVSGHQLVHLFVQPEHQGTGLGRHLLARAEAMITADGHTDLELHARIDNLAAIAFYRKRGWTLIDSRIHTVEHGINSDEHVLVKHRA